MAGGLVASVDAVNFDFALTNVPQIMNDKYYDHILVFQRYNIVSSKPAEGTFVDKLYKLDPKIKLKLSKDIAIKISEVVLK